MASFRKRAEKCQARVHRKDSVAPVVKSLNTKTDAIKWARHVESPLNLGVVFAPKQVMLRLSSVMKRYVEEATPTKKGEL